MRLAFYIFTWLVNATKTSIIRKRWMLWGLCSLLIPCPLSMAQSAPPQPLLAGASKTNITPALGGVLVGGFGDPIANHIHDELHSRQLVLDNGETRLVWVVVDNLSINREVFDEAKRSLEKDTGIPAAHMMMSATHTHSATSASGLSDARRGWNVDKPLDDYQRFVVSRIVDGVKVAINNLEPVQIAWGAGQVPQHVFNRRWKMKPGTPMPNPMGGQDKVIMNPGVANPNLAEPAGPTDPEVYFVSLRNLSGKPVALLANYSLHYVGGVPADHVSADYFGLFADRIKQLLDADRQDPPFIAMMSNGTSGDINNINVMGPAEKHPPYTKMRTVADEVAKEVYRVYQGMQFRDWVPLKAAKTELKLHTRRVDADLLSRSRRVLVQSDSVKPQHRLEKIYAQRIIQFAEEWPEQITVILQAFSIGDLAVAAIPFETFAEIGLEIKRKSPFAHTFTISLANGGYGYLPSAAQHQLGGYETWISTNRVEEHASDKIVEKLMELFSKLK
ncbi:MAG TPA: neutral/alkaline non-lysosomal ceramidase N-terminal domain-containing protein [Cyclobacteriaceae bacterium]|nr:neutral/alkaline non-lysosomal ceramidase N-terminal domain-containing protein [Cyclobacteriaceae bacterium]